MIEYNDKMRSIDNGNETNIDCKVKRMRELELEVQVCGVSLKVFMCHVRCLPPFSYSCILADRLNCFEIVGISDWLLPARRCLANGLVWNRVCFLSMINSSPTTDRPKSSPTDIDAFTSCTCYTNCTIFRKKKSSSSFLLSRPKS